ncbi:MAG: hypothetical protein DRN53_01445 [Thermoprotei archaeon]|nr:MAG: hypothetical protein DRN53_01445 [Thermoprotei archaeon]
MQLEEVIRGILDSIALLAPKILGAVIILLAGLLIGRLLERVVNALMKKIKIDDAFKESLFNRVLSRYGITASAFIGLIVKWVVYLLAIFASIDLLGIGALKELTTTVINYIPSLVGGIIVFVIGVTIVEFIIKVIEESLAGSKMPYSLLITSLSRVLLYFMLIIMTLSIMKIDVTILYSFANALFWGISIGVCVGLGIAIGFGMKDYVAKNAERLFQIPIGAAEKAEVEDRMKRYEKRVEKLEERVEKQEAEIEELKSRRETEFRALEAHIANMDSKLKGLVGEHALITPSCGGYIIEVRNPSKFPWRDVIITLSNNGFRAILEKRKENYVIRAEPVK